MYKVEDNISIQLNTIAYTMERAQNRKSLFNLSSAAFELLQKHTHTHVIETSTYEDTTYLQLSSEQQCYDDGKHYNDDSQ